jgi:hypothetical protein
LDVQVAGLAATTLFTGGFMYSNEMSALADAIDALAKALRGEAFNADVVLEGGKAYDGIREICAKIVDAAAAIAGRTAADIPYDNSTSGLTAATVQAAIDELATDT